MQKRLLLLLLIIELSFIQTYCQTNQISLEQKISNSIGLIEGEIIDKQYFLGEDEGIYTANYIKVSKVLKGIIRDSVISVTTLGGELDGIKQSWTNTLFFNIGDEGAFFLKHTEMPKRKVSSIPQYDVNYRRSGFYKYSKRGVYGKKSYFFGINHFYKEIGENFDKTKLRIEQRIAQNDGDCLVYTLEKVNTDFSLTRQFIIDINLYISYNGGEENFYRGEYFLNYDAEWFGGNIVSNENISINLDDDIGRFYDISLEDYSKNILKISIEPKTNKYLDLLTISEELKLLGTFRINLISIGENEPITLDYSPEEIRNTYLTSNGEEVDFACMKIKPSGHCDIKIEHILNDEVAAGVGDVSENGISGILSISGYGFLDPNLDSNGDGIPDDTPPCVVPGGHKVFFKKVQNPEGDSDKWISPLEGDYLVYTDTKIEVRVPSGYGYNEDGELVEGQYAIAGSGKIAVSIDMNNDGDYFDSNLFGNGDCTDKKGGLDVLFAARNNMHTVNDCVKAKKTKLPDQVNGGMMFFLHPNIISIQDKINEAFNVWKCETLVNFNTNTTTGSGNRIQYSTTVDAASTGVEFYDNNPLIDQVKGGFILINKEVFNSETSTTQKNILLHEIGHLHLLSHVNSSTQLLYPSNTSVTSISTNDKLGGEHISTLSSTDPSSCTLENMILINPSDCMKTSTRNYAVAEFRIYPNPVAEYIILPIEMKGKTYKINDINGIVISSGLVNESRIDVSKQSTGVYFISVIVSDSVFISKFVKI